MDKNGEKRMCSNRRYVYHPENCNSDGGVPPGTRLENIPEGWKCPDCSSGGKRRIYETLSDHPGTSQITCDSTAPIRSQMDPSSNHGTGGSNVGVTGTYNVNWIASLTYVDYLGRPSASYNPLADSGYVEFSVQQTF